MAVGLFSGCVDPYATSSAINYRPGYEVRTLPPGYRTEVYRGTRYYSHDGTYYQGRGNGYVVVDAPLHVQRKRQGYVDRLPPGYRMERYGGRAYYRVGRTYYEQLGAGFVVVDRPY